MSNIRQTHKSKRSLHEKELSATKYQTIAALGSNYEMWNDTARHTTSKKSTKFHGLHHCPQHANTGEVINQLSNGITEHYQ